MAEVEKLLPPTFEVRLIRDDSEFIRASLAAIEHLILGGILAAIIVLVFLRNPLDLIAAVAIPASIIGAFGVMSALDFTINQMTMLALTLMVGIVIDDAIVVLENIYRFVEEDDTAARRGRGDQGNRPRGHGHDDVALAVFLPVGFLGHRPFHVVVRPHVGGGDLHQPDRLVHADADAGVALDQARSRQPGERRSRRGFYRIVSAYTRMLTFSMAHRWVIVGYARWSSLSLVVSARRDQLHAERRRIAVPGLGPAAGGIEPGGHDLADGADRARHARAVARVSDTLSFPGGGGGGFGQTNAGSLFVRLKPIDEREFSQQELIVRARRLIQPYGSRRSFRSRARAAWWRSAGGCADQCAGRADLQKLDQYTRAATTALSKNERWSTSIAPCRTAGAPAEHRSPARRRSRRPRAGRIADGKRAGRRAEGDLQCGVRPYDVVLRAQDSYRRTPDSIAAAVRTGTGELVQLRNLVTFNEGAGPAAIERLNRQRQISISANPAPGRAQADGQAVVEQTFRSLDMEPGYALVTSGQSRGLGARLLLRHRVRAVVRLHVHGAGGAVRVVHPPGHDPADAPAGRAVRAAGVADVQAA